MKFDSADCMNAGDVSAQSEKVPDGVSNNTIDNTKSAGTNDEDLNTASENEINLNWKWSEGIEPSGRPIKDVLDNARREFLEKEGRLYSTEEVVQLVDDIRKELREKGKI